MKSLLHASTRSQLDAIRAGASRSYIFHGPRSTGKATTARELARRLNCQGDTPALCASCRRFDASAHPDLLMVQPEDKPSISIEQVRGVIHALSLRPYGAAGTRVVIVDEAHTLTLEAQNALLKLIEEPPSRTLIVLATGRPDALLPTVRSRCIEVYFAPVTASDISRYLVDHFGIGSAAAAAFAQTAAGAPGTAVTLATDPAAATTLKNLTTRAESALRLDTFQRLLLAKELTDSKADPGQFGLELHGLLTRSPDSSGQLGSRMQALETFRRQLHAKVSPRVALERLMLAL